MFVLVIDVTVQMFVSEKKIHFFLIQKLIRRKTTFSSNCLNCSSTARNSIFFFRNASSRKSSLKNISKIYVYIYIYILDFYRSSSLLIEAFFSCITRSSFSINCSRFFDRISSLFKNISCCSLVNLEKPLHLKRS